MAVLYREKKRILIWKSLFLRDEHFTSLELTIENFEKENIEKVEHFPMGIVYIPKKTLQFSLNSNLIIIKFVDFYLI